MTEQAVIEQTQKWIKTVVIDCNFCPFAAKVYADKTINYKVSTALTAEDSLDILQNEFRLMDENKLIETTLIIFPEGFKDFKDYLSLVKKAEKLLVNNDYEGIYQIASFHPDYRFQGSDKNDPANYTNRSVYPMLHILKEESVSKALQFFAHPENIPDNNIAFATKKGLPYMQLLLSSCKQA